ncbi:MAG TPA: Mrp/NBP35 family ATP-binding protein [Saprospiraceae bacterium]|nr:Mrp/NBP35 family ATP-binding protein [Saprospiraceae bacterium]HPI06075.1 Mrp/NBP35 family ATP-binding protein [Saprospiraceae bacterium]
MNTEQILAALRQVRDPQTGQDIVSKEMVQDLEIQGDNINFKLAIPSLQMQGKAELNFACIEAIITVYPQAKVNAHFIARTPNSQESNSAVPHIKNIIAVASGKGGVGKSTVSVNLALGLKQLGARVGLMDADVYGPSIPTMLGLTGQRPKIQDVTGKAKMVPLEAFGMPTISIGNIIEPEQAVVLRGPRLAAIIKQFINDVLWEPLDFLIVDLPPGTGDVQLTLVQTVPITGVVLVTTPQEVALADAIKAMNMFLLPQINVPILGVVENMAWFTPAELPENKYYIFGQGGGKKLALESHSVLLGQVPLVQSIREGGDEGKPAVLEAGSVVSEAFMNVAKNTLRQVGVRNEMVAPTQMVRMGE